MEEVQQTKILVTIVQLGSTKTMLHIQLNVSLIVEMGLELGLRNETMITHQMEMVANQTALLSSRAGFVMEEMLRTRTHALFEQLDSTKTTLLIQLSVSLVAETVLELDLKNETTTTQQMEMAASQIDQVLRVAGYEMEEARQAKTHAISALLGTIRTIPLTQLFVSLTVEMALEWDQKNEMTKTLQMEMAAS